MGRAKDIRVQPISGHDANRVIKALHYSGRVVPNSQVHLGVFLDGRCGGAMQYGPPMFRRNVLHLVKGSEWSDVIELNRMAFAEWLPRNGESRAIGYSLRWLRQTYPWLKWVISFADGTQCGDGTIYRAAGFKLTGIKRNDSIVRMPNGEVRSDITFKKSKECAARGGATSRPEGAVLLPGFQLRYIKFLVAGLELSVPELSYDEIARRGASMYRGTKTCASSSAVERRPHQVARGGSTPTLALHDDPGDS